jgi:hypothetical protein
VSGVNVGNPSILTTTTASTTTDLSFSAPTGPLGGAPPFPPETFKVAC